MVFVANWVLFICLVILSVLSLIAVSRGALTLESVCMMLVYISAAVIVGVPLIH